MFTFTILTRTLDRNFEANCQALLSARFRYAHFIGDNRYLKKTCFTQMASKFIIRVYIYIFIHHLGRRKHARKQTTRKIEKKH